MGKVRNPDMRHVVRYALAPAPPDLGREGDEPEATGGASVTLDTREVAPTCTTPAAARLRFEVPLGFTVTLEELGDLVPRLNMQLAQASGTRRTEP